jgi:uncharacterized membrane protein
MVMTRRGKPKVVVKGNRGVKFVKTCTVRRPAPELFRFWRRFKNLPDFMKHLISVTRTSDIESHWIAKAPAGKTIEWDAVIINEHENELIAWRTREDASVPHAGSVRFAECDLDRGTEVTVAMEYNPPVGKAGKLFAKMSGEEPEQQVNEDLRRFKAIMEAGEAPTIEGQTRGTGETIRRKK